MFAAPIHDLREALGRQSLGSLNPRPWAIMTGNCLGWIAYGYYVQNPFILMSNLPGLILSVWLNTSACQLEYHTTTVAHNQHRQQQQQQRRYPAAHHHPSRPNYDVLNFDNAKRHTNYDHAHHPLEDDDITDVGGGDGGDPNFLQSPSPILTQQQMWWLWVWIVWALILLWVGWISPWQKNQEQEALVVGWAVNLNLIFFYGAPLQSIQHVLRTKSSESIHTGYVAAEG
jgi:solute carrier family 50 protein (sugar transporter)